jgi:hypothetical protein
LDIASFFFRVSTQVMASAEYECEKRKHLSSRIVVTKVSYNNGSYTFLVIWTRVTHSYITLLLEQVS